MDQGRQMEDEQQEWGPALRGDKESSGSHSVPTVTQGQVQRRCGFGGGPGGSRFWEEVGEEGWNLSRESMQVGSRRWRGEQASGFDGSPGRGSPGGTGGLGQSLILQDVVSTEGVDGSRTMFREEECGRMGGLGWAEAGGQEPSGVTVLVWVTS